MIISEVPIVSSNHQVVCFFGINISPPFPECNGNHCLKLCFQWKMKCLLQRFFTEQRNLARSNHVQMSTGRHTYLVVFTEEGCRPRLLECRISLSLSSTDWIVSFIWFDQNSLLYSWKNSSLFCSPFLLLLFLFCLETKFQYACPRWWRHHHHFKRYTKRYSQIRLANTGSETGNVRLCPNLRIVSFRLPVPVRPGSRIDVGVPCHVHRHSSLCSPENYRLVLLVDSLIKIPFLSHPSHFRENRPESTTWHASAHWWMMINREPILLPPWLSPYSIGAFHLQSLGCRRISRIGTGSHDEKAKVIYRLQCVGN